MSEARVIAIAGLSAPAPSLVTSGFAPEALLLIFVLVPGLSIASIPLLQFNGDTGTTAYAYSVSDNFATPVTGIAGAASGIALAATSGTAPVTAELTVGNGNLLPHGIMLKGTAGVMDASAAPHIISGAAVWATTQQITSVQLTAGAGGGNLNAGTGLMVVSFDV